MVDKSKLKEVKTFRLFDYIAGRWEQLSFRMQGENMKLAVRYAFILFLTDIAAIIFKALALIYTVYLVVFEEKNVGIIMLVYGSINVFNGYMSDISRAFINLGENSLHIRNWITYMKLEEERRDEPAAGVESEVLLKLSGVKFKYPKTDVYAIDGISVDIFFQDAFFRAVDIDHDRHLDPDLAQAVVIIDLRLDLIAKLIVIAGFMVDLLEDISLHTVTCQIGVTAFAFSEQAMYLVFLFIYSHFLSILLPLDQHSALSVLSARQFPQL